MYSSPALLVPTILFLKHKLVSCVVGAALLLSCGINLDDNEHDLDVITLLVY